MTHSVDNRSLVTRTSLAAGLRQSGVIPGDTILVHTALSRLGFVVGAAQTVVLGLIDAVGGHEGTVMMPAYSGELSDPAEWRYPPVPEAWIKDIRDETPAYDKQLTPTRKMGAVPEYFRTYPGVLRSDHPQSSFAAIGKNAQELLEGHSLDYRFGPNSPLGRLYELNGKSVLLGAPPQTCSLFYLSQHHLGQNDVIHKSAPIIEDGRKVWKCYSDIAYPNHWFNDATDYLLNNSVIASTDLGDTQCIVLQAKPTIDAVVAWRQKHGC